ncbi:MAG: ribonuclease domain-containing protein [Corynebacterium sp.]|nr:ribonuclease domain-containing protein [Corynebacterium sp.]
MNSRSTLTALGGAVLVALAAYFGFGSGGADSPRSTTPGRIDECPLDTLPRQAGDVVDDIIGGGPFDYPADDGGRFGNYEGILPPEKTSYYREYTVTTPGEDDRGARRIVTGGGTRTDPDLWYYTDDHYESFCRIPDAED